MPPPVRFVTTADGVRVAYAVHGEGPPLVLVRGWVTHLELNWKNPAYSAFIDALAQGLRVVRFDSRGNGLSDWDAARFDLDALVCDLEAVMDGLGLVRAALWGSSFGGPVAMVYASRHPDRVERLILEGTFADGRRLVTPDQRSSYLKMLEAVPESAFAAFSYLTDPEPREGHATRVEHARQSISLRAARELYSMLWDIDVSGHLDNLVMPALVLHRRSSRIVPVREARRLAASLPSARIVTLEGRSHNPWGGDPYAALQAMAEFLGVQAEMAGADSGPPVVVLFTDIVGSTDLTSIWGDRDAQDVVRSHDAIVRAALEGFGGTEVKHTGDGIMASFPSATAAVGSAIAIQRGVDRYSSTHAGREVSVRVGINAGEPLREGGDLFGTAVQLAARICSAAQPGQILVSAVVQHLVAGKGFSFSPAAPLDARGFPEPVDVRSVRWSDREDAMVATAPQSRPSPGAQRVFLQEGEYWVVGQGGSFSRFRDSKGLRYLARLLARPNEEIHALYLATDGIVGLPTEGGAGPALDETAKAQYRRRLSDLREDLAEAEDHHDIGRIARLKEEMDFLIDELKAATGLGGRDRPTASASERARQNVQRAVKGALERIAEKDPELGRHLAATVRTGTYCSYTPDPDAGGLWTTA
jgi:pimeloyl-ACP methyl ester carboxylesterase